jgi:hypothetical protein
LIRDLRDGSIFIYSTDKTDPTRQKDKVPTKKKRQGKQSKGRKLVVVMVRVRVRVRV